MTADATAAIENLLGRAKQAHGEYEETELRGVYDERWPTWYARFLVDNGLGEVLGRSITAEALAEFLSRSWAEQERGAPSEPWEAYTAARIVAEVSAKPPAG